MDSWDTAFLLSGDADFVPAVASLRRRGKIVIGVGFSDASNALVRECYHYVNIGDVFLGQDIFAYSLFSKGGVVKKWLTDEIVYDPSLGHPQKLDMNFHLNREGSWRGGERMISYAEPPSYSLRMDVGGAVNLESRQQEILELQRKFGVQLEIDKQGERPYAYTFKHISELAFAAIMRRLPTFSSSIEGLEYKEKSESRTTGILSYFIDQDTGTYKANKARPE